MRKKESDAHSSGSAVSCTSVDRGRNNKPPRFSLRRFFCRRPSAPSRLSRTLPPPSDSTENTAPKNIAPAIHNSLNSVHVVTFSGTNAPLPLATGDGGTGTGDKLVNNSSNQVVPSIAPGGSVMECPLCLMQQSIDNFPDVMTCHHRSCRDCLRQYLRIEITESRVNIACPQCAERYHPNDIRAILDDESLMEKYEEFMLRRVLVADPDSRWCPAPDCGFAVIASGCAGCPKLECERPGCNTFFCYHCKQQWHPNQTCDAARAQRMANMRLPSDNYSHTHESMQTEIKPCPRCGAFIMKMDDGSCNHMTCAVCGVEFCWLCMKEISDLHYLSPSGCTFWGKKPWSRKKKILWQLGTLVGAPVGIALVAGITVPAMIIGIPVWVGRKLHAKYQHAGRHKRNLIITGGVTASIIVAPILAGIAVGVGVPILLGYIYGVVPISLCRSSGCGVTTTDSGGVHFEIEEGANPSGMSGPYTGGDAHSVEAGGVNVNNPSIGPSIGEMSVAMTNSLSASGSHIDRIGVIRDESDRESASHRAIAGASLSGSLCGSTVAGPSGFQNKLEVHADVAASSRLQKCASLSSDSANLSIDTKSATVSFCDDASTRALTGSLCTRDRDNMSAIVAPLDVNVEAPPSRHRHNSVVSSSGAEASVTTTTLKGSPTSTRSVNFLSTYDEVIGRSKRYKRQSVSVGDSIHEHTVRTLERASVTSFAGDDVVSVGGSVRRGHSRRKTSPLRTSETSPATRHCSSISVECVTNAVPNYAIDGLTEVENDRPKVSVVTPCSQQEKRVAAVTPGHGAGMSGDTSCPDGRNVQFPLRRRSCEIAMQDGRVSSTTNLKIV